MSRFVTIAVVISLIFMIHTIQLVAVETLGETRDRIVYDGEETDLYDKRAIADQIYTIMTKWSVVILDGGVLLWGFAREFKRARTTAVAPRP